MEPSQRIKDIIHAYSSQYYDPVKAHEYYERTKKLKGRSTSGMSEEQNKHWGVVKEGVAAEKKQKSEANKAATVAEIEAVRAKASEARERISEKLKAWLEDISREKEDDIVDIPKTASPEQKARLRAINAEISEKASEEKTSVRGTAKEEREKISGELKATISTVREKAKEIKETLDAATEDILNTEFDKIMSSIAGKSTKNKKSTTSPSASNRTQLTYEKYKEHLSSLKK